MGYLKHLTTFNLLLRGVHNDPVKIRSLVVDSVAKAADSDSVLALLERQQQRAGNNDSLVGIPLVESVDVFCVAIHHDAADATELPCSSDSIRCTLGYNVSELSFQAPGKGLTYVDLHSPCRRCLLSNVSAPANFMGVYDWGETYSDGRMKPIDPFLGQ